MMTELLILLILYSSSHNGCASMFAGSTLAATQCNASDPAQQWAVQLDGTDTALVDNFLGMCAGCGSNPMGGCGNNASQQNEGQGFGLGMQSCIYKCSEDPSMQGCLGIGSPTGLGAAQQTFTYSSTGVLRQQNGGVIQPNLPYKHHLVR